jgi:hypothetical protein
MLPQQSVYPRNKGVYTAAPLQNLEHGVDAFNPGNNKDIVVTADQDP